jgi:YidC/Oxa1 family membrane protein insertase
MMENNRNYILAIALSVLILVGWQFLYIGPKMEAQRLAEIAQKKLDMQNPAQPAVDGAAAKQPGAAPAVQPGTALPAGEAASAALSREQALASTGRIAISTQALSGSISLTGGRLDDLQLKDYRETVDPKSPLISLLNPAGLAEGFFAELGYIGGDSTGTVPGQTTVWSVSGNNQLTDKTPVTLTYVNDKGLTFTRTISVDDHYMFTVKDSIRNDGTSPVSLSSYGRVSRHNIPKTPSIYVLHEGFIGVIGENGLQEQVYKTIEKKPVEFASTTGGWIGITDKYWAAAIIPQQDKSYESRFSYFGTGQTLYQADYKTAALTIAPGETASNTSLVFAGAKEVALIDGYKSSLSIPQFDLMIDWGWFYFFTKPMFKMMDFFFHYFGNFGVAVLVTTIVVKLVFFPIATRQYASMANMKKVQPKIEELKVKFADDRQGLQTAMMELYKTEKINPIAGCWPVLLQIPVFFSLYKVIYVTIEMRHAPFFGWIRDLSAPDPTSLFNLFGLLPFHPPAALMIGVWPLIMGATMFIQMRMNPTPPDPAQAMIFTWMPVIFTFMMATFPSGLIIYWAWNNTLSVIQQGIIMKRHGVKIELLDNLKSLFVRKPKAIG